MKTKLILLASLSLLFSCATKSVVADTSKTTAPVEIKVAQEVVPVENTVVPDQFFDLLIQKSGQKPHQERHFFFGAAPILFGKSVKG